MSGCDECGFDFDLVDASDVAPRLTAAATAIGGTVLIDSTVGWMWLQAIHESEHHLLDIERGLRNPT
jgi:uncharacterized protein (DUF983 family)